MNKIVIRTGITIALGFLAVLFPEQSRYIILNFFGAIVALMGFLTIMKGVSARRTKYGRFLVAISAFNIFAGIILASFPRQFTKGILITLAIWAIVVSIISFNAYLKNRGILLNRPNALSTYLLLLVFSGLLFLNPFQHSSAISSIILTLTALYSVFALLSATYYINNKSIFPKEEMA